MACKPCKHYGSEYAGKNICVFCSLERAYISSAAAAVAGAWADFRVELRMDKDADQRISILQWCDYFEVRARARRAAAACRHASPASRPSGLLPVWSMYMAVCASGQR
eukprot:SAG22_NODE_77_length_22125_cov_46.140016_15_plen_108_part_00